MNKYEIENILQTKPKMSAREFFCRAGENLSGQAKVPGDLPCRAGGFKCKRRALCMEHFSAAVA